MKLPPNLNIDEVMAAVQDSETSLSNPGFCLSCGNQQDGCEPDARGYEREACGSLSVYGAAEILMMSF